MQWEASSKLLAVDDPLLLPEQEVHFQHKLVFRSRDTKGGMSESWQSHYSGKNALVKQE